MLQKRFISFVIAILIIVSLFGFKSEVTAQQSSIISIAWSPDGSKIAGSGKGGLLKIWDANTGN